jgi:hypothetical protein
LHAVEAELAVEKRASTELRSVVDSQREIVEALSSQVQASLKKQAELEAKVEVLMRV